MFIGRLVELSVYTKATETFLELNNVSVFVLIYSTKSLKTQIYNRSHACTSLKSC